MGSGCLRPKTRQNSVHIEVINTIYGDFHEITVESYGQVLRRLQKKGPLRKLLDHISSHRQVISDALAISYRIFIQLDTLSAHCIGLAIASELVQAACKAHFSVQEPRKTDYSSFYSRLLPKKQVKSDTTAPHSTLLVAQMCANKFEKIFLNTIEKFIIHYLLYCPALEALCNYCSLTTNPFENQDIALALASKLFQNIQTKKNEKQTFITLKAYQCLIEKCRIIGDSKYISNLGYFLQLWLQKNKQRKSKNQFSQNTEVLNRKQKKQQSKINFRKSIKKQSQDENVDTKVTLIIQCYIDSCVSSFTSIYNVILKVMEKRNFQTDDAFQNMLFSLRQDSNKQFTKGFFMALLKHIAELSQNSLLNQNILNNNESNYKNDLKTNDLYNKQKNTKENIIQEQLAVDKCNYNIILKRKVEGGLKMIERWCNSRINLKQIIIYSAYLLGCCFVPNLHCKQMRLILLNLIQRLQLSEKILLVNVFYARLKEQCNQYAIIEVVDQILRPYFDINEKAKGRKLIFSPSLTFCPSVEIKFPYEWGTLGPQMKFNLLQQMREIIAHISPQSAQLQTESLCHSLSSLLECVEYPLLSALKQLFLTLAKIFPVGLLETYLKKSLKCTRNETNKLKNDNSKSQNSNFSKTKKKEQKISEEGYYMAALCNVVHFLKSILYETQMPLFLIQVNARVQRGGELTQSHLLDIENYFQINNENNQSRQSNFQYREYFKKSQGFMLSLNTNNSPLINQTISQLDQDLRYDQDLNQIILKIRQ